MDALFIGRKKSAGKSIRSPLFGSILFGDEKTVEQFVEQYPSRSGRTEQEVWWIFMQAKSWTLSSKESSQKSVND